MEATEVLYEKWMPTSSWELAFLFGSFSLISLSFASYGIWLMPLQQNWRIASLLVLAITGFTYIGYVIWHHALLKSPYSIVCIEWIWAEPIPLWRITNRKGHSQQFTNWHRDSRVGAWVCCLMPPVIFSLRTALYIVFQQGIIIVPSQLDASHYRRLSKRLLEQGNIA